MSRSTPRPPHGRRLGAALVLALAGGLALGGCDVGEEEEIPADEPAMEAEVPTEGAEVPAFSTDARTEFEAGPAGGEVAGTLRLLVPTEASPPDEAYRIHVEVAGLEPGTYGWNIHDAPCGMDGPVIVPLASPSGAEGLADPITVGDDGRAEVETEVPPLRETWVEAGNYSVRIYRMDGGGEAMVACAIL